MSLSKIIKRCHPKENILAHLKEHFPEAGLDLIDVIKLDNFVVGKYQLEVSAIKSIYWGEHENEIFDDSKGYFGIDTGTLLVIYTKRGKIPYFRND